MLIRRFRTSSPISCFLKDDRGFSMVLTAILILPVLALLALCIDLGKTWTVERQLAFACRSAALHGARFIDTDGAEQASQMLRLNFSPDRLKVSGLIESIEIDMPEGRITVAASVDNPSLLMGLFRNFKTPVYSRAVVERMGTAEPYDYHIR